VTHDIGHTLGLRHNFAASTDGQSSVMEYINDPEVPSTGRDHAGPYDISAVSYLYGLSPDFPAEAFCTDDDLAFDPDCAQFDTGAQPLLDDAGPAYLGFLDDFLTGASASPPNNSLNRVAGWLRAGTLQEQVQALQILGEGLFVIDPALATPAYLARVDVATNRLWKRLFLDDPALRGNFVDDPVLNQATGPAIIGFLRDELLDLQHVRGFSTRRAIVDILKKLQISAALNVLKEAEDTITTTGLTGSQLNQTEDLLARIGNALDSYHINP
jgi:hypothetical protein